MWSADVALKPHYVVEPSKHLPSQHSNIVSNDDEIVDFDIAIEKLIRHLTQGTSELDVIPTVGMGEQGKTTIARKIFSQVTSSMDKGEKDDILADKLRKNLSERDILLYWMIYGMLHDENVVAIGLGGVEEEDDNDDNIIDYDDDDEDGEATLAEIEELFGDLG
ncbi:hypothetical protein BC332_28828 [Capsicum chinense]|nr:hypothetical protein BC332_28828 [Capsicum chinense]